jgi:hypothetical protein
MHIEKNTVEMIEFTLYFLKKIRGRLVIANDGNFFFVLVNGFMFLLELLLKFCVYSIVYPISINE